jgi:hypothetical protein
MTEPTVAYPSYSQKAAYPVAHPPIKAADVEPNLVDAPVTPTYVAEPQVEERTQVSETVVEQPVVEPVVQPVVDSYVAEPVVEPYVVEPVVQPVIELLETPAADAEVATDSDADVLSPFQISGSLVLEPQTNSIVVTEVPDALLAGSIITDSGEVLTTGAIEIVTAPPTGEIEIIPDSPDADSADAIDSATEFVSSVAPIRSSGVMNSKAKISLLPGKLRKSMEHIVLATTLAVSIITISTLLALAYMFGILR